MRFRRRTLPFLSTTQKRAFQASLAFAPRRFYQAVVGVDAETAAHRCRRYDLLLQRLSRAPFTSPGEALSILLLLPEDDLSGSGAGGSSGGQQAVAPAPATPQPLTDMHPMVVRRLVAVAKGNACCLDPLHSLLLMRASLDHHQQHLTDHCSASAWSAQDIIPAADFSLLAPLNSTLLLCATGGLSAAIGAARKVGGSCGAVVAGVPLPLPPIAELLPLLPWACATLVAFAAATPGLTASGDPEPLVKALTSDVVHPALRLIFAGDNGDVGGGGERSTATPSLTPSDAQQPAWRQWLDECEVWWRLALWCAPLLPDGDAALVSQRAWRALAGLSAACAEAVAVCHGAGCDTAALALDAFVNGRLPILQVVVASDGAVGKGKGAPLPPPLLLLLPLLAPIVRFAVTVNAKANNHEGETPAVYCARVRLLQRLLLEEACAADGCCSCGGGGESALNELLGAYLVPRLAATADSLGYRNSNSTNTTNVSSNHRGHCDEATWLAETALLEWHLHRHRDDNDDTHTHATTTTAAAAVVHLLSSGLRLLTDTDHRAAIHADVGDTREKPADGLAAGVAAAPVPDGVPSQALLLRYVQCWQRWVSLLPSHEARLLCAGSVFPQRECFSYYALRQEGSTGTATTAITTATSDEAMLVFAQQHERLLVRCFARCLGGVALDSAHVSPPLALHAIVQLSLLIAAEVPVAVVVAFAAIAPPPALSGLPSSSKYASLPLTISTATLQRLRRQCTGLIVRMRHDMNAHFTGYRVCLDELRSGGVRTPPPPPLSRDITGAMQDGTAPGDDDECDGLLVDVFDPDEGDRQRCLLGDETGRLRRSRRWQSPHIPAVIALCSRLGGGAAVGCSILPYTTHAFTDSGGGVRPGSGAPVFPAAVQAVWDDLSLLSLTTNLRSDAYGLETEVGIACPRLIASALLDCCCCSTSSGSGGGFDGVSTRLLARGLACPGGRTAVPFLATLLGLPVPLNDGGGVGGLATFFAWQRAADTVAATAGSIREGDPVFQSFYGAVSRTTQYQSLPAEPTTTTARCALQAAVRTLQKSYALSLLNFGTLSCFSDGVVRARHDSSSSNHVVRRLPHRVNLMTLKYGSVTRSGQPLVVLHPSLLAQRSEEEGEEREGGGVRVEGSNAHSATTTITTNGGNPSWPTTVPWLTAASHEEPSLQQLWKCLDTLFGRFRRALDADLQAFNDHQRQQQQPQQQLEEEEVPEAALPSHSGVAAAAPPLYRSSGRGYHRHISNRLLDDFQAHGEGGVTALGTLYTAPFIRFILSVDASLSPSSSTLSSEVAPPLASAALTPAEAQLALQVLFLSPATTFTFLSPALLQRLWHRAAEAIVAPVTTTTTAPSNTTSPHTFNALVTWYTVIRLAACLDRIKREACAYAANEVSNSNSNTGAGGALSSAGVFTQHVESPFEMLDELAGARRQERQWPATTEFADSQPTPSDDGDDVLGDDLLSLETDFFSPASIAFAEVLGRRTVYDAHTLVRALREEGSGSGSDGDVDLLLFSSPVLTDLMRCAVASCA